MSSTESLSSLFAEEKYLIQPSAVEYIEEHADNPSEAASKIITKLDESISTVTVEEIEPLFEGGLNDTTAPAQDNSADERSEQLDRGTDESVENTESEKKPNTTSKQTDEETELSEDSEDSGDTDESSRESVNPNPTSEHDTNMVAESESLDIYEDSDEDTEVSISDIGVEIPASEVEARSGEATVEVLKNITGQSTGTGEYKDFVELFTDRFEKLQNILSKRVTPVSIEGLERSGGQEVSIIGRVTEARTTQSNNRLVVLEDRTGEFPVVFTDEREQELTEELLEGEVIAIEGEVAGNGEIMFGNKLLFPEVPPRNSPTKADRSVKAAFISDIHMGADTFASESWNQFVDWIRQQPDIEYLFVAGDIIEGIGVYPGQEEILEVVDMYDQYDLCGEAFKQLPEDLEIIICSGNHDMVRLAEPQPALPEKFTRNFPDNVTFTGNPATVQIEDDILVEFYHGMSINGFTDTIPSANVDDPTTAMKHMVKKRHLAPLYGYNTRISPESEDHLVLNDIPDIIHSGHVHTFGADTYNGVELYNTGAWQYQTDFQEKMNIVPTVGNVIVTDLQTYNSTVYDFGDE